jgi:hypothetical protein
LFHLKGSPSRERRGFVYSAAPAPSPGTRSRGGLGKSPATREDPSLLSARGDAW